MKILLLLFFPILLFSQTVVKKPYTVTSSFYPGHKIDADQYVIEVPENYQRPENKKIKLHFLFMKSYSKNPASPILYLAGGPGFSGISNISGELFSVVETLRQVADVVVLDQRGTGLSMNDLQYPSKPIILPAAHSLTSTETADFLLTSIQSWKSALVQKGVDIHSYHTLSSVEDIEQVRKSLGVTKLNLWGFSYGSHVALAYAKYFPNSCERIVVGGVNPLDDRFRLPSDGDDVIRKISQMAAQVRGLSKKVPHLYDSLQAIMRKLELHPVTIRRLPFSNEQVSIMLTKEDLQIALAYVMSQPWFVKDLPVFIWQLQNNNFSFAGQYLQNFVKSAIHNIKTPVLFSMHCASGLDPIRRQQIEKESKASVLGNGINYPFMYLDICDWWGMNDLGNSFRKQSTLSTPILMFNGDLDGRTSYRNAKMLSEQLPNSKLVKVVNGGHDIWLSDPAIQQMMLDFYSGQTIQTDSVIAPTIEFRSPDEGWVVSQLYQCVLQNGVDSMLQMYQQLQMKEDVYVTQQMLRAVLQRLIGEKKVNLVGVLLAYLANHHPNDWRIQQQYGEYLLAIGDAAKAQLFFGASLRINPFNLNAKKRSL